MKNGITLVLYFFINCFFPPRLPCFVELVEKFLTVFQRALSGLSESEREDMALHLIPEVCEFEITITVKLHGSIF